MKQGDLVIKKTAWQWHEHNPWMKFGTGLVDDRIGIVINPATKRNQQKVAINCSVLWADGKLNKNFRIRRLHIIT